MKSIEMVANWYSNYYSDPKTINNITAEQIKQYQSFGRSKRFKMGKKLLDKIKVTPLKDHKIDPQEILCAF